MVLHKQEADAHTKATDSRQREHKEHSGAGDEQQTQLAPAAVPVLISIEEVVFVTPTNGDSVSELQAAFPNAGRVGAEPQRAREAKAEAAATSSSSAAPREEQQPHKEPSRPTEQPQVIHHPANSVPSTKAT